MSKKFDTSVAAIVTKQHDELRKLDSKAMLARAAELGNTPSHGGIQRTVALMAFTAAQTAKRGGAEAFDFAPYFKAFAVNYYDGSAPNRKKPTEGSLKVLGSTYDAFATAGMMKYNAKPIIVKVLSALDMGMPARAKVVRDLVKAYPDECPSDAALVKAMAGKGNQTTTYSPVARAKAMLASATTADEDAAFVAAIRKTPKAPKLFAALLKASVELVNLLDVKTDDKSKKAREARNILYAKAEKLEGARAH